MLVVYCVCIGCTLVFVLGCVFIVILWLGFCCYGLLTLIVLGITVLWYLVFRVFVLKFCVVV